MSATYVAIRENRKREQLARKSTRNLSLGMLVASIVMAIAFITCLLVFKITGQWLYLSLTVIGVSLIAIGYMVFRLYNIVGFTTAVVEKKATETVDKTEGKFKALIQNSMDIITIIDIKGKILYLSPSSERILGYPIDEMLNLSIYELMHSEDHCLLQNALDKGESFVFSYRMQHYDGTWLYFESIGTNLTNNPQIKGVVINSRDITDRKKEEEERRQKEIAAVRLSFEKAKTEKEKEIIEASKAELEKAYQIIEHHNHEITDSITYAFRIQTALLPPIENIQQIIPQSFVLWRPKDIVSGDFFWFAQIGHRSLIATADCTGHGVPGAFMTMIGNTLLNQIVMADDIYQPNEILERLHLGVRKALKQAEEGSKSRDGMDIAFTMIDHNTKTLYYAAANRPLYFVRNGELEEYKADKYSIGGLQTEKERHFTSNEISLQPGDTYYIFSDGYHDQFGGSKGRKFMTKQLKEKLIAIQDMNMESQREFLDKTIVDWMGTREQIDDILVVGVRI
ncbi:MAG: PAS domain S-box protein [Bacteroidia bacterium]|nr:PAS domain S-box protein [Bacteroidia bacterium]